MAPQRSSIKAHAISIHLTDGPEVERAKCLKPIRGSLDHIPCRMDFVIEDNEHALATRIRTSRDAQCGDEIHSRVRAQCAHRPLRADQNCWLSDVQCEVKEISGLFERSRPMPDHKSLDVGLLLRKPVKKRSQFAPFLEADRAAANVSKRHRK